MALGPPTPKAGVSSGFFNPNRKAAWNVRRPLIIYKNNKMLQLESHLLINQKKSNFKVHKMKANSKKKHQM